MTFIRQWIGWGSRRTKYLPGLAISLVLLPSKESKISPAVNPEASGIESFF